MSFLPRSSQTFRVPHPWVRQGPEQELSSSQRGDAIDQDTLADPKQPSHHLSSPIRSPRKIIKESLTTAATPQPQERRPPSKHALKAPETILRCSVAPSAADDTVQQQLSRNPPRLHQEGSSSQDPMDPLHRSDLSPKAT